MSKGAFCTSCGREARPDDRFCGRCGTPLGEPGRRVAPEAPSLDELFSHFEDGQHRPATILFSDISRFTTLSAAWGAERVYGTLNEVMSLLADVLRAHGAYIDKIIGDEIMALFGVPIAQERSAEWAVLAALAMRERLHKLNEENRFGGVRLDIHTGINIGWVMVGPLDAGEYRGYTAIGSPVNVAHRLVERAEAGQIYISAAVADAIGDAFELESLGCLELPGLAEPVETFRVASARGLPGAPAAEPSVEAPLIHRESECQWLCQRTQAALDNQPQVVCVVGSPGIGKSRLLAHWLGLDCMRPFRVLATTCYPHGEHFPLLPIVDLVAQVGGVQLQGWPPRATGDVDGAAARLPADRNTAELLVSALRHWDLPSDAEQEWRKSLDASLAALLRNLLASQPVCVVLEDAGWLDEASREVLASALSRIASGRLLVALSTREPCPDWVCDRLGARPLVLHPLPQRAIEALIDKWAAPTVLPVPTKRAIVTRSQGHPYYARELVRRLSQRADMAGTGEPLPNSLEELFLAQLDQLPIRLHRLVLFASVIGEPLSVDLLAAATGETEQIKDAVDEAVAQGLLRRGAVPGQFVFGRRLLFETAYSIIPPTQRQGLHAGIADHLVDALDRLGEAAIHAAAHHAYLGYRDTRALRLLLQSSRQYRHQYANRHAAQAASRAIELIAASANPAAFLEERLQALLLLAQSYLVMGQDQDAAAAILEAEALANGCANRELVGEIAICAATLCLNQRKLPEAYDRFSQACTAWEALGNHTRVAHAMVGMALVASQRGEREHALHLLRQAAERPDVEAWVRGAVFNNAGVMLIEEGRYEEAEPDLREGLSANKKAKDRRGVAHTKASLGELAFRRAKFAKAERLLKESVTELADMEDAALPVARGYLARTYCMKGDLRSAEAIIAEQPSAECGGLLEAALVLRLAQLEIALARWLQEARPRPSPLPPELRSSATLPSELPCDSPHTASWHNAHVEALCVLLEAALLAGEIEGIRVAGSRLADQVDQAEDRHLRYHAAWLLGLAKGAQPSLPQDGIGAQATMFALRRRALLHALAQQGRAKDNCRRIALPQDRQDP